MSATPPPPHFNALSFLVAFGRPFILGMTVLFWVRKILGVEVPISTT
jgi:hypothetical protein